MSDTPRTDQYEGVWATRSINGDNIFRFAKQLERELNAEREKVAEFEDVLELALIFNLANRNSKHQFYKCVTMPNGEVPMWVTKANALKAKKDGVCDE